MFHTTTYACAKHPFVFSYYYMHTYLRKNWKIKTKVCEKNKGKPNKNNSSRHPTPSISVLSIYQLIRESFYSEWIPLHSEWIPLHIFARQDLRQRAGSYTPSDWRQGFYSGLQRWRLVYKKYGFRWDLGYFFNFAHQKGLQRGETCEQDELY